MRRVWAYVVAIVLFGLIAWDILNARNPLTGGAPMAAMIIIALTLTWWFEESKPNR